MMIEGKEILCTGCVYFSIKRKEISFIEKENFEIFEIECVCTKTGESFPVKTKCEYFKPYTVSRSLP